MIQSYSCFCAIALAARSGSITALKAIMGKFGNTRTATRLAVARAPSGLFIKRSWRNAARLYRISGRFDDDRSTPLHDAIAGGVAPQPALEDDRRNPGIDGGRADHGQGLQRVRIAHRL